MPFIIIPIILIAVSLAGFFFIKGRKAKIGYGLLIVLTVLAAYMYLTMPVCLVQDTQYLEIPIEELASQQNGTVGNFLFQSKVFKQEGDQWYACYPRLERMFFF